MPDGRGEFMNKARLFKVALAVLIVITVICVSVTAFVMLDDGRLIKVDLSEAETQSVKFERFNLVPGESCDYTLRFTGDAEKYVVTLDFSELGENQTLKNYVYVSLDSDGENLYSGLLSDVLAGEELTVSVDFTDKTSKDVKVTYRIPSETGNEVQNATADFELSITAKEG